MKSTREYGAAVAATRDALMVRVLAVTAILLPVPSLVGWIFGIAMLVRPLTTFGPARVSGVIMIPAAGGALLAHAYGRRWLARWLAAVSAVVALVGIVAALTGRTLPLDVWAAARVATPLTADTRAVPLSTGVLFLMNAAVVLLVTARQLTGRTLLLAGALTSIQVTSAGVLLIAQLTGLADGLSVPGARAPLYGLLAVLALGVAQLQRLSVREPWTYAPPSARLRWAAIVVGTSTALVMLVLWRALTARESAQARTRAMLAAAAVQNAVQRQYRSVTNGVGRSAAYLNADQSAQDVEWTVWLPRLVKETAGLEQLLWFDTTGTLLQAALSEPLPYAVLQQVRTRVPRLRGTPAGADSSPPKLRSEALANGPWRLLLWTPVRSPSMGTTVLVALVDDIALVREVLGDVDKEFDVRVLDGGRTVLESRDTLARSHEPAMQRKASGVRYEGTMVLGARQLGLILEQRAGVAHSPLPDVVLVLGLIVALLLAVVLWLQRRILEQASAEGMSRMQAALEGTTDGVWELDVQQGRVYRSPALIRYLHLEPAARDQALNSWTARMHPDDAARATTALRSHLRGELPVFECEYRVRAGDGQWHTLVDRGRVVEREPDGTPLRLLGISADVTERTLASAARDASERRFRVMFDTSNQVQLLLDLDGTILEANQAATGLVGGDVGSLQGTTFWLAPWWPNDPTTAEQVQERVEDRFSRARDGELQRFEVSISQGREHPITVEFSLKPIVDSQGHVSQVLAEGRDLTVRKRAEESLREIGALTTMGQLAARVAHEINNPLAGIQNAFLLIRDAIPRDHPHYRFVGAIEREIARIAAVTRQLYETYRPDQMMARQSSVILAVSDAVSFLEQVNRGRQVRIVTDMSRAPSMVPVPDALLRQTLYNLVQNAVDVSPVNGTVGVSAAQEGASCVLRVTDEGPGIPAAIRERIFDPFFSTKDRTTRTGGMGIGLALVRQSVLAVGGRIDVHDRPEGGTLFEVRLPKTPLDTGVLR